MRTLPAPIDVAAIFPELAGTEKQAVRLHPHQATDPGANASKMGGVFFWPEHLPWPQCSMPEHMPSESNLERLADLSTGSMILSDETVLPGDRLHNDNLIGVVQLRLEDVPELDFPAGTDLFQLLWCPRSHPEDFAPYCRAFWWDSRGVARTLSPTPTPRWPDKALVPPTCIFAPERITEYPGLPELPEELQDRIVSWEESQGSDGYSYQYELSVSPGTKVGGYVGWIQPPSAPRCPGCATVMEHLLTVASSEGGGTARANTRWNATEHLQGALRPVVLGDWAPMTIFVCRRCPDWPIVWVSQA